ncbi:YlmH family RNA-binding protein [Oceanobacillus damuensis]|uniref:YlmH family RNA-binding protein n=1 Tax=Oceanobacillus damuensis TaxID=937928 RepID=UPI0008365B2C|nr:RNA-binding protein [Oceanobacillus damuensis]
MDIYQHFRKEEQPFIDQVLSWMDQVELTYQPKLTDFLDPREQQIVDMLIGTSHEELKLYKHGGSTESERKRMIIAPFYEEVTDEMFQLKLLEAAYQNKFMTIEHRDVMGSFLSLGVKRKKLGDISTGNGLIQIVLADEIAAYITANLTSIKKANVLFEEKPFSSLKQNKEKWMEMDATVSSLRLDAIIKEIYNISRKDASSFIQKQQVKVNYKVVDDSKFQLREGDLISVRGKGRSKLTEIRGLSKKDKVKISVATLK